MITPQLAALHVKIIADPTALAFILARDTSGLKDYLNTPTPFVVWRTTTPKSEIHGAINWKNLTPNFNPLTDTTTLFTNSSNVCLSRQESLTNLFLGGDNLATGLANIHQALSDALTNVPSGDGGSVQQAGFAAVKLKITRTCNMAEKLSATGTGTAATPGDLVFEGTLSDSDASTISLHDDGSIWSN